MKKRRSVDMRQQALGALAEGLSRSEVCRAFGIHRSTLGRWGQRAAAGQLENRPACGGPRKIKSEQEAALVRQLEVTPDATLDEHVACWKEATGQMVSRDTMRRALLRLEPRGWTRKKKREGTGARP